MSKEDWLYVDCDRHGRGIAAVVCRHLCNRPEVPQGFVENCAEPGDKQAWCAQCEELFVEEGELTDRFRKFNDFALVCDTCYETIKATQTRQHWLFVPLCSTPPA